MLIKSIIRSVFYQVVTKVFVFLFNILLARYLTVDLFGEISFLLSVNLIFSILIDLGANQFLIKNFSEVSENILIRNISHIFKFKIIISLILLPIIFFIYHFNLFNVYDTFLYLLLFLPIFENLINSSIAFQNAQHRFKLGTQLQFYFDITRSIIIGIFFILFSVTGYVFCSLVSYFLLSIIYVFLSLRKNESTDLKKTPFAFFRLFKLVAPFFLLTLLTQIYFRFEIYLLKIFSDSKSLGLYTASFKIYENLMFIPAAILGVILPVMNSRVSQFGVQSTFNHYRIIQVTNFLIIYPISAIGIFFSSEILFLFYGNNYVNTGVVLILLFIKFVILSINSVYFNQLIVYKMNVKITLIYLISLLFQAFIGFLLVSRYDFFGAAIASLIGEIAITICYISILNRNNFPILFEFKMILFLSTLFLMGITMCFFLAINVFIKIIFVISLLIYLIYQYKTDYKYLLYNLVPNVKN